MADYNASPESKDLEKEDGTLGKAKNDAQILQECRERLKRAVDEHEDLRKLQKDDLLFRTLEQWPSDIRKARENDVSNGPRPCLTIDQINQYLVQVVNDMRQNRPAVKVRPVDDKADLVTAEVLQGMVRQIEDQSVAQIAYMTAGESAVGEGEGYFRFTTEYEDETSFNQAIRVKAIPDMFSCLLGPHVMPTGEDADHGFIFEDIPVARFRRMFPGAKYMATDFSELGDYRNYWGDNEKIRVCEYLYFDYAEEELVFTADGKTMSRKAYEELEEKPEVKDKRPVQAKRLKWCKLTGVQILEKRDLPMKYLGIVKVTGKQSWVNGKRITWGLVRPAKDSLRMYNYWASTITEKLALSPKTPFIMAEGQDEGHESEWQQANVKNYARLTYKPVAVGDTVVPPPQRQPPAPLEVAMIQQLSIIREDVKASLGMYKASVGDTQPNQSGRAILALTQESDTGTFHFQDNMALSIAYGGRIMLDMIPHYYDVARVVKVLGEDGKMQTAQLDPSLPVAKQSLKDDATGAVQTIYNPNVGIYDVTVTVGPSYNTKRMESATLFTELANAAKEPGQAAVLNYLAIKNSDANGAEHAATMLERMLPPGVVPQEGQPPIPPGVAQQMMQMKQAGDALAQENQELKSGAIENAKKIEAMHAEKMKELELQGEVEREKARQAQKKAEEEMALKRWVAIEEAKLAREVAEFEAGVEHEKAKVDKEVKLDGIVPKEVRDAHLRGEAVKEKGGELKDALVQDTAAMIQPLAETLAALKEQADTPKRKLVRVDKIRGATGELTKAVMNYSDGSKEEVSVN